MILTVDSDVFKEIAKCRAVTLIQYRLSSSGLGFHFKWTCPKRRCKHCEEIVMRLDDPKRIALDYGPRGMKRRMEVCGNPRILWDEKAGRSSGTWTTLEITRMRSEIRPTSRRTVTRVFAHIV